MKRILIATDGTPAAAAAVEHGLELAAAEKAEVAFLQVLPGDQAEGEMMDAEGSEVLSEAAARAAQREVRCSVELARGEPAEVILARSEALDAGVIVLGSRGRGARVAAVLGTVSAAVLRGAERPVFIVRTSSHLAEDD